MAEQTRPIDPRLELFDNTVVKGRGKGARQNCHNILRNIRSMVTASTNGGAYSELDLVAELMDTARCDEEFGDSMKLVRSRLLERMGHRLYSRTLEATLPDESPDDDNASLSSNDVQRLSLATNHYRSFINEQTKSCMQPMDRFKAEMEDYGTSIITTALLVVIGRTVLRGWQRLRQNTGVLLKELRDAEAKAAATAVSGKKS
eukprot:TRINITY_DN9091_c0_g1_i1.p1 TRINITY_DN9091_c0_g1~~TRINITY_DN9091_c0_g1_i1.p1  ORF type:complete len:203 (+),score=51.03 TRINITY_DN9091_c0_g1_i1:76-684(+)